MLTIQNPNEIEMIQVTRKSKRAVKFSTPEKMYSVIPAKSDLAYEDEFPPLRLKRSKTSHDLRHADLNSLCERLSRIDMDSDRIITKRTLRRQFDSINEISKELFPTALSRKEWKKKYERHNV